jgi:hypothetical protein
MALPMDGLERLGKAEPMAPAEEERTAADVAMGGWEGGEKTIDGSWLWYQFELNEFATPQSGALHIYIYITWICLLQQLKQIWFRFSSIRWFR